MTKILVAASPIYGHFAPQRAVAEHLAAAGYDVTMLSLARFRDTVDSSRIRFEEFTGEAAVDPEVLHASPERLSIPAGPERFAWDMRNIFVRAVAAQHRDIQRVIAQAGTEPVLLIHETGLFGAAPSLLGARGPRPRAALGLGPVSFTLSSVDTAPFGMGLPPATNEEERTRNREAYAFLQGNVLAPAQRLFERTLIALGVTQQPIPFFLDSTVLEADLFLQLSIEELSYKRSDTPEHVRFVGPLPAVSHAGELPEWWGDLGTAEQIIVVTQGTVANQDFSELIEPAIEGLTDFPGIVVVATGREGKPRQAGANVRVAEFLPFATLLPRADLLVTNGGFGAVQQALSFGKPMVVSGLSEEKLESNVRLAATGAALDLAAARPTAAEVRRGVETVLGTASYRQNARRLAAEYAKVDAFTEIEKAVSELV
jgi:UDP:flavonoid glycosyltransferase YjiC (YdhE family)